MLESQKSGVRPLEIFGISEEEETLYRWLLGHASATLKEISEAQNWPHGKAQRIVNEIEKKGLITHSPQRPRRYIPMAPDLAIEALANKNHKAVDRALALVPELRQQAREQSDYSTHVVEVMTNRETIIQTYELIHNTAEKEILGLVRQPLLVSQVDIPIKENIVTHEQAHARGVSIKSIFDVDVLKLPEIYNWVQEGKRMNENNRIISSLPFKMILADKKLALIPLDLTKKNSPSLLVRPSALLDALYALFESLWTQAAPIFNSELGLEYDLGNSQLDKQSQELITMMVAGFNDKSIAYQLGVTTRTLQRHVAKLMSMLNARTRFQLGWFAASKLPLEGFLKNKDK